MPRTVKIRPDQPLFKADAFHMPLWIHAPFEVVRGFYKWCTATLAKDNPHNNPMHNATFARAAKLPHRNAFWTGKPVIKRPKWYTLAWRWSLLFILTSSIKYLPWAGWAWMFKRIGSMLKWIGLDVIPWAWAHLWSLPLVFGGTVLGVYLLQWGIRRGVRNMRARMSEGDAHTPWYEYVLGTRDQFTRWLIRRGWIR